MKEHLIITVQVSPKRQQEYVFSFSVATPGDKRHPLLFIVLTNKRSSNGVCLVTFQQRKRKIVFGRTQMMHEL